MKGEHFLGEVQNTSNQKYPSRDVGTNEKNAAFIVFFFPRKWLE